MPSARVVKNRTEFEGKIYEELALVQGADIPAWSADAELRHVGRSRLRVDGPQRVSGRARYTTDLMLPGMLHARVVRSPHPHARVIRVDAKRALALAGVRSVVDRTSAPELFDEEVHYVGAPVAVVVGETEEIAADAAHLVEIEYESLPFVVDLEEAVADRTRVQRKESYSRGDARRGFREADIVVDARYTTSTQLHNCLEPHGAVAQWDGERLTLWESTQAMFDVRKGVAKAIRARLDDVRVICDYMGGGFGSKLGHGHYSEIAAVLAKRLGRPIRCVMDRREENLVTGNRSATVQRVRVGATKDGKLTALEHVAWSGTGTEDGWVASTTGPSNGLYEVANVRSEQFLVLTNTGPFSAFRAPGYVEGTFALESAMDELADKLALDPLALRRKNYAKLDPQSGKHYSLKRLDQCYSRGAELAGWSRRKAGGTAGRHAYLRRGMGVSTQVWGGGGGPPAYATIHLNADGTAIVRAGLQDIGSGTKTAIAQIAAEELSLPLERVRLSIGETDAPYGPASGGSMTTASLGPAVRLAAVDVRRQLLEVAAGLMEVRASEIHLTDGHAVAGRGGKKLALDEVFSKLQNYTVIGRGSRHPNPEDVRLRSFGAHFAEVEVDIRTGAVRVLKIVAVHQIGRIVNPLNAKSQVEGGVTQALGYAVSEGRVLDRLSGHVMNANLEDYKIPTVKDVPDIVVEFVPDLDRRANNLGGIGLGEPPIIPTAAAIANAVANACGARVRTLPITPARVLEALRR